MGVTTTKFFRKSGIFFPGIKRNIRIDIFMSSFFIYRLLHLLELSPPPPSCIKQAKVMNVLFLHERTATSQDKNASMKTISVGKTLFSYNKI